MMMTYNRYKQMKMLKNKMNMKLIIMKMKGNFNNTMNINIIILRSKMLKLRSIKKKIIQDRSIIESFKEGNYKDEIN